MKSILYVGATLMIGASIYGFIDYRKTSRNKQFSSMYEVKEIADPTPVVIKKEESVKKEDSKKAGPDKGLTIDLNSDKLIKSIMKKKKFSTDLFSRSRPPMRETVLVIDSVVIPKTDSISVSKTENH